MKYKEVVYIINDVLKLVVSDDSYYESEHILFLVDKFRGYILKKYYDGIKKKIPISAYQTICLDLERYTQFDGNYCGAKTYLRSVQEIPYLMSVGQVTVSSAVRFTDDIQYVDMDRFIYANGSKYYQPIYATIDTDKHLYLKSNNTLALNSVRLTAIFQDSTVAAEFSCDGNTTDSTCDVMEKEFPLEDNFLPELLEMVVRELSIGSYKPTDNTNNAKDDLSDISSFIRHFMKSKYSGQYLDLDVQSETN